MVKGCLQLPLMHFKEVSGDTFDGQWWCSACADEYQSSQVTPVLCVTGDSHQKMNTVTTGGTAQI